MGVKISDLPQANTSTNSDLFAIVQAGETKQVNKSVVVGSVNNNIANEYSTASTYNVGDMCIYQGNLYVCVTAITTAEEWNATNWQRVTMGEQLVEQITELNNKKLDKTQILNSQSTSTTDSYSANYVNGIIESGSNTNGNYIKYIDGTMICTDNWMHTNTQAFEQWGNVYEKTMTVNKNFPARFTGGIRLAVSMKNGAEGLSGFIGQTVQDNTKIMTIQVMRPVATSANTKFYFDYIAIGRWK